MERKKSNAELDAEWLARRREIETIYERMQERFRLADEREARSRARLRRLSFGLLGRP